MVLLDKNTGRKLYPICKFEQNQHKLANAIVRAENDHFDAFMDDGTDFSVVKKLDEKLTHLRDMMDLFNNGVHSDGVVYMPYPEADDVKRVLADYDATH